MKYLKKFLGLMLVISLISFAQDKTKDEKMKDHKMNMKHDHMHMENRDNDGMKLDSLMRDNESIVREGIIDLTAIDKNKNGKVFQDQMCWNVISDSPGECPQCGMTLKEVTVKKAKDNLKKYKFKVK